MTLASPRARLFALGAACAVLFAGLGLTVRLHTPVVDRWIVDHTPVTPDDPIGLIATFLSAAGVLTALAGLVAVMIGACRGRPRWWITVLWTLAVLVKCALVVTFQSVFERSGPPRADGAFSYPSGHATIAGAIAITAIVVTAVHLRHRLPTVIAFMATAMVMTMASRVALKEHYLTDVVGSALAVSAIGLVTLAVSLGRATRECPPPGDAIRPANP